MPLPDAQIHPHATGEAAKTVAAASEPQDLIFYSGWFCPFVARSWLSLIEKGIPYQYKEVNPYHKEPEFLEISPKGLVPALKYKGEAIPESLVICDFLEEAYPDTKPLMPKDPLQRAKVRLAIDNISKSIIPAFFRLLQSQEQEKQDAALEDVYKGLRGFQEGLKARNGPFYMGEQLTLADIALIPWATRFYIIEENRGFDIKQVGKPFAAWVEHVLNMDSVKAITSDKEHYTEIYGRYLRNEAQSEAAKATRAGTAIP